MTTDLHVGWRLPCGHGWCHCGGELLMFGRNDVDWMDHHCVVGCKAERVDRGREVFDVGL